MRVIKNPGSLEVLEFLKRPQQEKAQLDQVLKEVFDAVAKEGDAAILRFTEKFDKVSLDNFTVSDQEFEVAINQCSDELKKAIDIAFENISKFHAAQKEPVTRIETTPGVECWRESKAIQKVGLYIPGGTAPLFSTVLMLGIPAKLAGCKEIIICTPPNKSGNIHPAILYAANRIGIRTVFKVGGIQAIAGMTFGTDTIPQVFKLFGPGNSFVTAAKQYALQYNLAIDMPAGPSEVMILADDKADPDFVAADLLSQAEHGIDSQTVLLCFSESFSESVQSAILEQLDQLPRKDIAKQALENSRIVVIGRKEKEWENAMEIVNNYAPEHFILMVEDEQFYLDRIENAGSVFIGRYTPESAGDYASGTNHTLPTNGFAKAFSGVSLDSFVKKITFQRISKVGLKNIGPAIEIMAAAEELQAHKNAVTLRLNKI